MSVVAGELEVLSGIKQPPIVLPEAFPIRAQVQQIPSAPEAFEVGRPVGAALVVELAEHAIGGNGSEVGSIGCNCHRIISGGPFVIGLYTLEAAQEELGARELQQSEATVRARIQVAGERGQRRVRITNLALHPSPSQQHFRITAGRSLGGST